MKRTAKISDFVSIPPRFSGTQEEGNDWLSRAHSVAAAAEKKPGFDPDAFRERMRKLCTRISNGANVGVRFSEVTDFTHTNWETMGVYNLLDSPSGAGATARMKVFEEAVDRAFEALYPEGSRAPEGVIHVTCTGYVSPSGAQKIVTRRGWNHSTTVTHAYHMGCAAAIPALRMAVGFAEQTDIVHTELCTLHLNPSQRELEHLVVQLLFADGFIRYSMISSDDPRPGLEVLQLREEIVPDSEAAMSWAMAEWGMAMTLSREVPHLISGALEGFLKRLFDSAGLELPRAREEAIFAIHPGGPQIIDQIQKLLGLSEAQVRFSREVLYERGNMSSATLPHVWKKILESPEVASGRLIVSMAFAPGLTICAGIFRKA